MNHTQQTTSYRESCFPRKQVANLYPDRIHVQGSVFLSQDYDWTIPLSQLSGVINRSHMRSQMFQGGIFLAIMTGIVTAVLYNIPGGELSFLTKILYSLPFVGIVLALLTVKKIEAAHFMTNDGRVILSIHRSGRDKAKFEEFISSTAEAIRCYKETQQGAPALR